MERGGLLISLLQSVPDCATIQIPQFAGVSDLRILNPIFWIFYMHLFRFKKPFRFFIKGGIADEGLYRGPCFYKKDSVRVKFRVIREQVVVG